LIDGAIRAEPADQGDCDKPFACGEKVSAKNG
jgi:hypothetical protein